MRNNGSSNKTTHKIQYKAKCFFPTKMWLKQNHSSLQNKKTIIANHSSPSIAYHSSIRQNAWMIQVQVQLRSLDGRVSRIIPSIFVFLLRMLPIRRLHIPSHLLTGRHRAHMLHLIILRTPNTCGKSHVHPNKLCPVGHSFLLRINAWVKFHLSFFLSPSPSLFFWHHSASAMDL